MVSSGLRLHLVPDLRGHQCDPYDGTTQGSQTHLVRGPSHAKHSLEYLIILDSFNPNKKPYEVDIVTTLILEMKTQRPRKAE